MTMYPEIEFDLYDIDDKQIKVMIDMLLADLKVEINNKKDRNNEIKESTLIRKNIIKKRLGL